MTFLQKWRKLGITWYVLSLLITRWSAYAHGKHCFQDYRGRAPITDGSLTAYNIGYRTKTQNANRICHPRQDMHVGTISQHPSA
ncbi:hypothetical protein V8E52_002124 [Russula decolorans]